MTQRRPSSGGARYDVTVDRTAEATVSPRLTADGERPRPEAALRFAVAASALKHSISATSTA
jgi:hypothetical protein